MKETEFFYEPCVDEAQTIRNMKRQLLFLKQYTASLRLHSLLYGEDCVQLQVEDELSDYLNYTRSIVQTSRNGGYVHRDPVLDAMERQRRVREKVMEQDQRAYVLLQGILQLEEQEKELLLDLYVRGLKRELVLRHQGDIVESTLNRRLRRACRHLAALLHLQVLKECS